jgi:hypothetical protein
MNPTMIKRLIGKHVSAPSSHFDEKKVITSFATIFTQKRWKE